MISQQYILFKPIEIRHSPWLVMIEDPKGIFGIDIKKAPSVDEASFNN